MSRRSGDRPYPPGMGLRPKACAPSRREISMFDIWILLFERMGTLNLVLFLSPPWICWACHPPRRRCLCRKCALANQQTGTEHDHGGMCSQSCPDVGKLVLCVDYPAIDPWGSTLSAWQMTILRTCVVSMTYTSCMVSRPGGAR